MSSKNDEEEPSLAQKMFPLLKSLNGLDATDTLNSFFVSYKLSLYLSELLWLNVSRTYICV